MAINTYSKLDKAKTQLVRHHAFFATILMSIPLVEDDTSPTAWTDGTRIGVNPKFIESLDVEEIMFVLAHEVMHIAMMHPWRREGREPRKWNYAADYAENQVLVDAGFKMVEGGLLDAQYQDMHAEKIYAALPESKDGDGQGNGQGDGFRDELRDAPGDAASTAQSEAKAQSVIAQAAKVAQMAGQLPGALKKLVDEALAPVVNWREELRRFMTAVLKDDQSWARGQRRFMAQGLYLPTLYNEGMGEVVVGIDTSGSVWDQLPAFLSEVSAICAECRPEKIHVIYCDMEVNRHDEFDAGDEISPEVCGGGGTDLRRLFAYVNERNIDPKVLIFCTDGETPYDQAPPDYAVIWAVTGDVTPPWGDVVRL